MNALAAMAETITRKPRPAQHVLSLKVDQALFDKVKRRERTMCVRPASKFWADRLDGVTYTHVELIDPTGRKTRVGFKGAERKRIPIAPDKRVTLWEIYL